MKSIKGTKTASNLLKAFAGESQARNRYTFYSAIAETDGYIQIKNIFKETADNEKEHAERFYYYLLEGLKDDLPMQVNINADYPIAQATTLENLKEAANGEHEENSNLYPSFAEIAKEEGFPEIEKAFLHIASAEVNHENRFRKLIENIENNQVFTKNEEIKWKCDNCGYTHEGKSAPAKCPSCTKPKDYFEVFTEPY